MFSEEKAAYEMSFDCCATKLVYRQERIPYSLLCFLAGRGEESPARPNPPCPQHCSRSHFITGLLPFDTALFSYSLLPKAAHFFPFHLPGFLQQANPRCTSHICVQGFHAGYVDRSPRLLPSPAPSKTVTNSPVPTSISCWPGGRRW